MLFGTNSASFVLLLGSPCSLFRARLLHARMSKLRSGTLKFVGAAYAHARKREMRAPSFCLFGDRRRASSRNEGRLLFRSKASRPCVNGCCPASAVFRQGAPGEDVCLRFGCMFARARARKALLARIARETSYLERFLRHAASRSDRPGHLSAPFRFTLGRRSCAQGRRSFVGAASVCTCRCEMRAPGLKKKQVLGAL